VGVELGLGGVERAAEIELAGGGGVKAKGLGVEVADLPEGLSPGGEDEDVAVAQGEEVGALPHFAGVDGVFWGVDGCAFGGIRGVRTQCAAGSGW